MKNNEDRISSYIDALNSEKIPKEHTGFQQVKGAKQEQKEMEALMKTVRIIRTIKEPAVPGNNFEDKLLKSIKERDFTNDFKDIEDKNQEDKNINDKDVKVRERDDKMKNHKDHNDNLRNHRRSTEKHSRKKWLSGLVSVAAILVMILMFFNLAPFLSQNSSIVYAIEKAYEQVQAYYGNLEIITINEEGEKTLQSELEIWSDRERNYYVKVISGKNSGLITVNNGKSKWKINPEKRYVYLYSAFPDAYGFAFELGREVEDLANALEVKEQGMEFIGEREAKKLEITPQGGSPYYLWIDNETKLPLQKESAMTNGIQYRVTYTAIKYTDSIPEDMLTLTVPEGYVVDDTNFWQIVNSLEEATEFLGFVPKTLNVIPDGFLLKNISIDRDAKASRLSYESVNNQDILLLLENKNNNEWKMDPMAVIGKVNDNPAEIVSMSEKNAGILSGSGMYAEKSNISSVRWYENGSEYTIVSNLTLELIEEVIENYMGKTATFPKEQISERGDESGSKIEEITPDESSTPQVEVSFDLEVEENEQKSVDAGHSPWKLDPVFVAQVFASLEIYPEGITGDYPIAYEEIQIIENDGINAVAQIGGQITTVDKVYLEKVVRQDETGIWTVVGYDPK